MWWWFPTDGGQARSYDDAKITERARLGRFGCGRACWRTAIKFVWDDTSDDEWRSIALCSVQLLIHHSTADKMCAPFPNTAPVYTCTQTLPLLMRLVLLVDGARRVVVLQWGAWDASFPIAHLRIHVYSRARRFLMSFPYHQLVRKLVSV